MDTVMKRRVCLGCKKKFWSTGKANRFCDNCQKRLSDCYKDSRYAVRLPDDSISLDAG
jgi:predicted amidophosphoribosyltransferase